MALAASTIGADGMSGARMFVPQPHSAFRSPTLQARPEPARLAYSPLLLPQAALPYLSNFPATSPQVFFQQPPACPPGSQARSSTFAAAVVPPFELDAPRIGHVLPKKLPFALNDEFVNHPFGISLEPFSSSVTAEDQWLVPELSLLERIRTSPSQSPTSNQHNEPTKHKQQEVALPSAVEIVQPLPVQEELHRVEPPVVKQEPPLSPRIEGKLAKYRANIPALVVPEPIVSSPSSVLAAPEDAFSCDPLHSLSLDEDEFADSSWLEVPSTPVPVGRMWSSLSRYPTLQEHCIAHLGHIDDVRSAVMDSLEHQLPFDPALAMLAPMLLDKISRRFEQLHVDAAQLFLVRAQAQGVVDERASRAGLPSTQTFWRSPPPVMKHQAPIVKLEASELPATPQLVRLEDAAPMVDVKRDNQSAMAQIKRVQAVTPTRALDAEADAEVASMATHLPRGAAHQHVVSDAMTSPPPLVQRRSVTSSSEESATSAPSSVSTQRLMSEGEGQSGSAGSAASPPMSEARRRREDVYSCPALSFTEKMRLLVVTPVKEEDGEQPDTPHPALGRSQSVQQRPPSSCRRRLNFDKPLPLLAPSVKPPRRSMTPSATSSSAYLRMLAKNAPLEAWLLGHLDDPFPTVEEKTRLSEESGLSYDQVQHWFINARGRKLRPLLAEREAAAAAAATSTMQLDDDADTPQTPAAAAAAAFAPASLAEAELSLVGCGAKKAKLQHESSAQLADWASNDGVAADSVPAMEVAGKAASKRNKKRRRY